MPLFAKGGKRQVLELPIASIHPNPHQPRQHFDPDALEALSRSIAQVGVLGVDCRRAPLARRTDGRSLHRSMPAVRSRR